MKFQLGKIVATPGALSALEASGQDASFFLDRHVQGDWGDVDEHDQAANDKALVEGERILSAYKTLLGERIWIISEPDRSATTILLPSEY